MTYLLGLWIFALGYCIGMAVSGIFWRRALGRFAKETQTMFLASFEAIRKEVRQEVESAAHEHHHHG